jgi:hypothetical protein
MHRHSDDPTAGRISADQRFTVVIRMGKAFRINDPVRVLLKSSFVLFHPIRAESMPGILLMVSCNGQRKAGIFPPVGRQNDAG